MKPIGKHALEAKEGRALAASSSPNVATRMIRAAGPNANQDPLEPPLDVVGLATLPGIPHTTTSSDRGLKKNSVGHSIYLLTAKVPEGQPYLFVESWMTQRTDLKPQSGGLCFCSECSGR